MQRRSLIALLLALAAIAGACSSTGDLDGALNAESNLDGLIASNDDDNSEDEDDSDAASDEPEIPSVPGAPLNRFDLQVGQCFNEGSWYDEVLDRRVDLTASIDCGQEHQSEVYHEAEFPAPSGAPFPGEDSMTEWSTQVCYDQFAAFVDAEYEASAFEIGIVAPTKDTFEHPVGRHRRVFCYVYESSGETTSGSARGAGF